MEQNGDVVIVPVHAFEDDAASVEQRPRRLHRPGNHLAYALRSAAQQQSLRDRIRQVQEWTLANGFLQGGLDADSYRVRREQVQQTQQQIDRLRQLAQRQGPGY